MTILLLNVHLRIRLEDVTIKTIFDRGQVKRGVGAWQNGFFADFYFRAAGFFRGFSRRIFPLIFVGKSAQKNPPGKSPAKSSKFYTTKIPDTFLQRGRADKSKGGSAGGSKRG